MTQIPGIGRASLNSFEKLQNQLFDNFRQMNSQRRIASAADDAAGLAIAKRLQALETAVNTGVRNLNDGVSLARVAEGGLDGVSENLGRMRELAIQGQNGTLNDSDRQAIQQEYDQLAAEVDRVSQSTSFGGQSLLDGSLSGSESLEIADGTGGEQLTLEVQDQSAASLGIAGQSISDPNTLQALDQAISSVSSTRATIGSFENRASSQIRSLQQSAEATAAARSRIEDLDLAEATASLAKNQILAQGNIHTMKGQREMADAALRLL